VNLFGPYDVIQAFVPRLAASRGTIVNVLSLASLAGVPFTPAYAISKAAAFSMTQSLRAVLAGRGIHVLGVFPGPVDTDMTRDLEMPKASPESVARAIFDGLERGDEDILPDPVSASLAESWRSGEAKTLERQFVAMAAAVGK
jgi:NAD(P)-dependent dehydrogenase (short-subunit alcohol dehydrogenase family)